MLQPYGWRVLVVQLAERVRLAEILGEPLDAYGRQMQRLLLAGDH